MRRARTKTGRVAEALALVGLVVLHACEHDAPASDASAADAPASLDARRPIDTGLDAVAPADAASDLDLAAGWVPLEGPHEACAFTRATHPEVLVDDTWESCRDIPGCTQLVPDDRWTRRWFNAESAYWHDGARGYFLVAQTRSVLDEIVDVLLDTEGRFYAAWRHEFPRASHSCLEFITIHDGYAALSAASLLFPDGGPVSIGSHMLFRAPLDTIGSVATPWWTAPDGALLPNNFFQDVSVSAEAMLMQSAPSVRAYFVEDGGWVYRGGVGTADGAAETLRLVGHDGLWISRGDDGRRLVTGSLTREQTTLYEAPGVILTELETDGHHIVWHQVTARDESGLITAEDLWVAPYTTDPAAFAPRRVGALRGITTPEMGSVGDGLYAYGYYDDAVPAVHHLWVVDLVTGQERHLALSSNWNVELTAWVTSEELAFAGVTRDVDGTVRSTLARVPLSALSEVE